MSCTAGTLGMGWQLVSLMETLSPAQGQMFVDSCLHTHPLSGFAPGPMSLSFTKAPVSATTAADLCPLPSQCSPTWSSANVPGEPAAAMPPCSLPRGTMRCDRAGQTLPLRAPFTSSGIGTS